MPHRRVATAALTALAVAAVVLPACGSEPGTLPSVPAAPRPLLIKHGWDMPSSLFVADHAGAMDELGFDGVVVSIGTLGDAVNSATPVSLEQFRSALAPLRRARLTTMTHNFVLLRAGSARVYDDPAVPLANVRNFAKAAAEAGLEGIAFDNENYDGVQFDHPEGAPGRSLGDAQEQARRRGSSIMRAVVDEWPDARVLAFVGPYVSAPETARAFDGVVPWNDVAWANELSGPFTVGMVEATIGTAARVVDGGEIYSLRAPDQFSAAYDWSRRGVAERTALVPAGDRSAYTASIQIGYGVYDRPVLGQSMDPAAWRTTLGNALDRADRYVWAYTERYDWWGVGWPRERVPRAWVDATRAATAH
jgi:hypothetical protein